jgi:hypothetical protein
MASYRRSSKLCALSILAILSGIILGCGGNGNNVATTPAPTPGSTAGGSAGPSPTPPPAPTPTPTLIPPTTPTPPATPPATPVPTPPTPTPTPTPNASGLFQATLFSGFGATVQNHGQVIVDATAIDGSGSVQLTGATAMTEFTLSFCPFPSGKYACFTVITLTTDTTGAAQGTFHFASGTWAGDFQVTSGGNIFAATAFDPTTSNQSYTAALQPQTTTNPNGINLFPVPTVPQDPLSSGRVTISGSTAQVTLQGAVPNAIYNLTLCTLGDGSGCFQQSTAIPTDASGNVNIGIPITQEGGDIILVERTATPAGFGFIAGFKSP